LIPLVSNAKLVKQMQSMAISVGVQDGSKRLLALVNGVL
jgi:hypothetical protein